MKTFNSYAVFVPTGSGPILTRRLKKYPEGSTAFLVSLKSNKRSHEELEDLAFDYVDLYHSGSRVFNLDDLYVSIKPVDIKTGRPL